MGVHNMQRFATCLFFVYIGSTQLWQLCTLDVKLTVNSVVSKGKTFLADCVLFYTAQSLFEHSVDRSRVVTACVSGCHYRGGGGSGFEPQECAFVSCDAGHLFDSTGTRKNRWSLRMEWLFHKRALCFRNQYGLQKHFLHVSTYGGS